MEYVLILNDNNLKNKKIKDLIAKDKILHV
jgi:hypothetical protein